jgi:hypothetical protein
MLLAARSPQACISSWACCVRYIEHSLIFPLNFLTVSEHCQLVTRGTSLSILSLANCWVAEAVVTYCLL